MAPRNLQAVAPLAPSQTGMLLETLAATEPGVHVEQLSWPLHGPVDAERLAAAWAEVVAGCEVLRTGFTAGPGAEPLQFVLSAATAPVTRVDLSGLGEREQLAAVDRFLDEQRTSGFALDRPPLLRLALLRRADGLHHFVLTFHHIILDGWSVPILAAQAFATYGALGTGGPRPPWTPRPYRDFVTWLKAHQGDAERAFWSGRLDVTSLPTALGGPAPASGRPGKGHGSREVRVDRADLAALERLRREHRVTLAGILQGAWALLLAHYSGAGAVVFGATVAGRPPGLAGVESMVGQFVNTIPVGVGVPASGDLWQWLRDEQARRAEERAFEHCSTGQIHEWLGLPGSAPLFESILVFENYPMPESADLGAGLTAGVPAVRTDGTQTRFPLVILATPGGDGLHLRLVHQRNRLRGADAATIAAGLRGLLHEIATRPGVDLGSLRDWIARQPRPAYRSGSGAVRPPRRDSGRPASAAEAEIAALWQELLKTDSPPGPDEDFFAAGGHSLLALRLTQEIRVRFGAEVALSRVFADPTVRGLAEAVAAGRDRPAPPDLPALLTLLRPGDGRRPLFLAPPGAGSPVCYQAFAAAIGTDQAIYGLQTPGLDELEAPLPSVAEIAARLVGCVREVQPAGPYRLGGWSFGAMVAWEMACHLQAGGEQVEHLILLDAGGADPRAGRHPLHRITGDVAALAGIAAQVGVPRSWDRLRLLAQTVGVGLPDSPAGLGSKHLRQGQRSFRTWSANGRASVRYDPGRFDGPTVLVRAAEGRGGFPDPLQRRLSRLTGGHLRVLSVPGNHMTMMLDPALAQHSGDAVARTLRTRAVTTTTEQAATERSAASPAPRIRGDSPVSNSVQIIAFDGTEAMGGTGYVAAALLSELHRNMDGEQQRSFLNSTTIFAGTSAGSANALFFAMSPDPDAALAYAAPFWKRCEQASSTGMNPLQLVRALAGLGPLLSTRQVRGVYLDYFGMAKLGDLRHKVIIPAFQLDEPNASHPDWKPKVFHNLDPNSPDMEELVVDVLLRSSSPPILTPAYQSLTGKGPGYIDGGIWANSPSMAVLAQVVHARMDSSTDGIRILSVSNGDAPVRMRTSYRDGFGNIGYLGWLLNPLMPGALLDVLLNSNQDACDFQVSTLLGERYCRLDPELPGRILQFTSAGIDDAVQQILELDDTREQIAATVEWLAKMDWYTQAGRL